MAQTTINFRMDEELKQQFEAFCTDVGMNMTTAFSVFARTVVREQRIPFAITTDIPNAATRQAMAETLTPSGLSPAFSSVEELMEDLYADD